MEFPQRAPTHITESASWKILQKSLPAAWIIREVSERDYGIDCYLEIVWQKNEVTGDLCSLQLKGSDSIDWNKSDTKWGRKAHFSGIKKPTVNYWMRLPVPVFLMWAEIGTGNLYFAPVKEQVRAQYPALVDEDQATLGFDFFSDFTMNNKKGEVAFFAHYLKERSYERVASYLTDLLIHHGEYHDFIVGNQYLDSFMEVEYEDQFRLRHIYERCKFLSIFLGVEWTLPSLNDLYKSDKKTWNDPYCAMHQSTLHDMLVKLEPIYADIIDNAKDTIVHRQKDYWEHNDQLLYKICERLNTEYLKRK